MHEREAQTMCPHAVIAIISGYISDEVPSEVTGCADVMMDKPVRVETFNHLLKGVARIGVNGHPDSRS